MSRFATDFRDDRLARIVYQVKRWKRDRVRGRAEAESGTDPARWVSSRGQQTDWRRQGTCAPVAPRVPRPSLEVLETRVLLFGGQIQQPLHFPVTDLPLNQAVVSYLSPPPPVIQDQVVALGNPSAQTGRDGSFLLVQRASPVVQSGEPTGHARRRPTSAVVGITAELRGRRVFSCGERHRQVGRWSSPSGAIRPRSAILRTPRRPAALGLARLRRVRAGPCPRPQVRGRIGPLFRCSGMRKSQGTLNPGRPSMTFQVRCGPYDQFAGDLRPLLQLWYRPGRIAGR